MNARTEPHVIQSALSQAAEHHLSNAHLDALEGVQRIELQFPKFTDGRAYSQALLLRRRYRFAGDIRATGDVLIDQLVHMHRSGFSSAVLAPGVDPAAAERQFARYAAFYQGDVLEPRPLFAREAA